MQISNRTMEGSSVLSSSSFVSSRNQQNSDLAGERDELNSDMSKSTWMLVGEDFDTQPEKLENFLLQVSLLSCQSSTLTIAPYLGDGRSQYGRYTITRASFRIVRTKSYYELTKCDKWSGVTQSIRRLEAQINTPSDKMGWPWVLAWTDPPLRAVFSIEEPLVADDRLLPANNYSSACLPAL